MGSCLSTSTMSNTITTKTMPEPHQTQQTMDAATPKKTSSDPDNKPMIFAIMRNGHERCCEGPCVTCSKSHGRCFDATAVARPCPVASPRHGHGGRSRRRTTQGVLSPLGRTLRRCSDEKGLHDAHTELAAAEQAVQDAINNSAADMPTIQAALAAYVTADEAHLKQEEDIMMPMVQKLVKEGHRMKKYMRQEMLAAVNDKEFFIKFAVRTLERHSSPQAPRFRVFAHALWGVATPEEWTVWNGWIKESVAPATYQQLQDVIA